MKRHQPRPTEISGREPAKPAGQRRPAGGHGPGGGPPAMHGGEKARDAGAALRRLLKVLRPYRLIMSAVLLFAAASTVFAIIGPKLMGRATTLMFEGALARIGGSGGIDFGAIGRLLVWLVLLYAVSGVLNYIQAYLMSGVAMRISYRFRRDISEKIARLPLSYFDRQSHGEVLSRVTNDVDTVSNTLNQSLSQTVTAVTTLAGVLIMMLSISWQMTLAALALLPLTGLMIAAAVRFSQRFFVRQQALLGEVNSHVEEMYSGHLIVRVSNAEQRSISRFSEINQELHTTAWKSQFFSGLMMPVMTFIGNIGYVVIVILGSWLAIRRMITVGDIQAFIQYVRSFTQPVSQAASIATVLQSALAASERVFEFLDEAESSADAAISQPVNISGGHVCFEHVRFAYDPQHPVIHDFSLEVRPGQRVAIVGPTGAGKTTLVKLLMRFYDIDSGRITIDGHDIRGLPRHELRRHFGMVLQDTWLFNGTISENIRFGRPDADQAAITAAAEAAYADHFIHTLPGGYEMMINEDASNLSQGQKQLLTIARAILADPDIMILDEATSSVDTRTEMLIQNAMLRLMEGRTSFVIAHRLSTIRDADLILALRDGDIAEQGTHEELLAAGGFYADLYNSQFEVNTEA